MSCLVTKLNGSIEDPTGRLKNFKEMRCWCTNTLNADALIRRLPEGVCITFIFIDNHEPITFTSGSNVQFMNSSNGEYTKVNDHSIIVPTSSRYACVNFKAIDVDSIGISASNLITISNRYQITKIYAFDHTNNVLPVLFAAEDFKGLRRFELGDSIWFANNESIDIDELRNDAFKFEIGLNGPPSVVTTYAAIVALKGDLNNVKFGNIMATNFSFHINENTYFSNFASAELVTKFKGSIVVRSGDPIGRNDIAAMQCFVLENRNVGIVSPCRFTTRASTTPIFPRLIKFDNESFERYISYTASVVDNLPAISQHFSVYTESPYNLSTAPNNIKSAINTIRAKINSNNQIMYINATEISSNL